MNENNNVSDIKKKINNELKAEELAELIKKVIQFLAVSGMFGYIGYSFCIDNNYDIQRGIVFGMLFPIGIAFLKEKYYGIIAYIVYILMYLTVLDFVPTYIGIIILSIIVLLFIKQFSCILKKDRLKEVEKIFRIKYCKPTQNTKQTISKQYISKMIDANEIENNDELQEDEGLQEEYECEMCFKKISEEEYELYDCMCEECFDYAHFDFNKNTKKK